MMEAKPFHRRILLGCAILIAWIIAAWFMPRFRPLPRIHDPSAIVMCDGEYWFFTTGQGIPSWHSTDLINWRSGPRVFPVPPSWAAEIVPGSGRGSFWAPDITYTGGKYRLYYAVSRFGTRTSAIGLAENATLDPSNPAYHWTDLGPVVHTTQRDNFNAIDPAVLSDAAKKMWMVFGSFWSGIKLTEINPATGLRAAGSQLIPVAAAKQIEAPYLITHDGYYYLFVNWGLCCKGLQSTYNIRMGRSVKITGPYLDKSGIDLKSGGGTLFLGTEGRYIGPGQIGIFQHNNAEWFTYHFYDGNHYGQAQLGLRKLDWSPDGWPIPGRYATDALGK